MSKSETESSRANDEKAEVARAVAALKRGEVICFPTETLYGLAADALDLIAVEKVFALKGREANNPLPVLVAHRAMANQLVVEVSPLAEKLMARFWPGPLTLVLPARREVPKPLLNNAGGVGVRISSQPIAAQLLNAFGRPITATSANPSGQIPARTVAQAKKYFARQIEIFINGGELRSKVGSTVAETVGEKIKIIREGEVTRIDLERALGKEQLLP